MHDGDSGKDDADRDLEFQRRLGERLRAIRRQKRLSLQEVEDRSGLEFKASVLGAYERAERAISVPRLQRLASFYGVPVDQLLPPHRRTGQDPGAPVIDLTERAGVEGERPVVIDLSRLAGREDDESRMLARYLTLIQLRRQDFNGRVLSVRRDDHQALAAILGTSPEGVARRLDDLGLSHRPSG